MAETTSAPSATAQATEASPTSQAAATLASQDQSNGAGISNEFLADLGLSDEVETKQEGNTETPAVQATESAEDPEAAKAADALEDDEEEAPELNKDETVPDWVQPRLAKNAAQKKELREKVESLTAEKEAAEKALAEVAEKPFQILPSSPLAHLETIEALESEAAKVVTFMKGAKASDAASKYQDYDEATETSATFEADQAYCLSFLEAQTAHAKMLNAREQVKAEVKKTNPALFDAKSTEFAERAKLYANDPRVNPDFDQFIADALRGRAERLKKAEPAKAVAAKPKAEPAKSTPPPYTLPAATRSAVKPSNAPNPQSALWGKAKQQSTVSIEEMEDAEAFA